MTPTHLNSFEQESSSPASRLLEAASAALRAATIGQAVVLPLATLAGGWLYRDEPHGAPIAAAVS